MEDSMYNCGSIKRADLRIRIKYYGIKTKIYLVGKNHYTIQLLNFLDIFDEIKKDFDYSIRNLSDWIELTSEKPKTIITEIEPLVNIAQNNEGLFLTNEMFQSLLISRFPNIDFVRFQVEHQNGPNITITVAENTDDADITAIKVFVQKLKISFVIITVEKDTKAKDFWNNKNVDLACTDRSFPFSVTDSEFWFENVEKIYAGEMHKESLRYFDSSKTKCYMDFSVFYNENINIRSNALLYDTIYISFPLRNYINEFFQKQHLNEKDLEQMVERNKLVILLPNTESRYDKHIIDRLYQINKNAVVSKRGINALMAMFYCELEKNYLSFWEGNEHILEKICEICIKSSDINMKRLYDWLIWPIKAKLESYELLTSYSPLKLPVIGANKLLENMLQNTEKNEKLKFELLANSNAIHLATALQATYFPFAVSSSDGSYSDEGVSNILGNILNKYQYLNNEKYQSIKSYSEMLERERKGIYLLKPDNSISVNNILDYSDKYSTSTTLKKILENLSELESTQLAKRISEYNNQIAEIGKEKITGGKKLNYILSGAGFIPIIGTGASIISIFLQLLDDLDVKSKIVKKRIESGSASTADDIYLLDKLSRVAKISL